MTVLGILLFLYQSHNAWVIETGQRYRAGLVAMRIWGLYPGHGRPPFCEFEL